MVYHIRRISTQKYLCGNDKGFDFTQNPENALIFETRKEAKQQLEMIIGGCESRREGFGTKMDYEVVGE
jgi:hypothetical protein